jgi:hypothetical protein
VPTPAQQLLSPGLSRFWLRWKHQVLPLLLKGFPFPCIEGRSLLIVLIRVVVRLQTAVGRFLVFLWKVLWAKVLVRFGTFGAMREAHTAYFQ